MFEEMTTYASDYGGPILVTDLVHELSSGLEIPFLLNGSCSPYERDDKCNELLFDQEKSNTQLNDGPHVKEENDFWMDHDLSFDSNYVKTEVESALEIDDFQQCLVKSEIFTADQKTDSSGHGSGSDTSSTELWTIKSERDSSPVAPKKKITATNLILVSNNQLKSVPISPEGSKKSKQSFKTSSRAIRIQPKPSLTTLDVHDNQQCNDHTVMCNVFKGVQTALLRSKNSANGAVGNFRNSIQDYRKDAEILQAKRKQERMIRNRESAYLSRKRKKEYVTQLENQVQELVNENNQLRQENCSLKERLMKYEKVEPFSGSSKARNVFVESPRKTTALLALMLTVCLNIGSFSNFINERAGSQSKGDFLPTDNRVPFRTQNVRHTRSLLWTDPQFEDLNSLANLSKTSCPVNQTESIRLESELRRWIRGDDDFSRPVRRNVSRFDQYFSTSERALRNQSKSKRKNRVRKARPSSDLEMDVFRMEPHFFNFDTFFEAIHRRDDTFYLVSFSADHLLLPALAHNKTSRPKMSLMLPAFLSNATLGVSSDQVELMQIDCEVTNTQLLSVSENDIPSHMRPYSNSTSRQRNPGSGGTNHFSDFLVDGVNGKNSSSVNVNGPVGRGFKNDSSSRRFLPANGENIQGPGLRSAKANTYKFSKFHSDENYNQSVKDKQIESKRRNIRHGYFFHEKTVGDSLGLHNESNSAIRDGVQYLDPQGKNFLKTLIGPPTLSQTKNFNYSEKPYVKTLKNSMKFLIP